MVITWIFVDVFDIFYLCENIHLDVNRNATDGFWWSALHSDNMDKASIKKFIPV